MVIVLEFSKEKEIMPVILSLIDKQLQILLQFLIHVLSLAIALWMISCGGGKFDAQELVQLLSEFSHKLSASVQNNTLRKSMVVPDIMEVKLS